MKFYTDLHIHSKYSRATSKQCDLENLCLWAKKKGIHVIGTGDFTHPAWFEELKTKLVSTGDGLFQLKKSIEKDVMQNVSESCHMSTKFMLTVEISTIYKKGDKVRKVHHVITAPTIHQAQKIRKKLDSIGNIKSDGRPILGLDSRDLLEIVLTQGGEDCYLIPAHIWTPWFSALGSKSGFDSIDECYADLAKYVFAVETGLSSDPIMNWRVESLDRFRLVSNSDLHSPSKLGREATVFDTELSYHDIFTALKTGKGYQGTVEFYPEEGKYHFDGHRKCGVCLDPKESRNLNGICPKCGKPLTLGVAYRVEELATRKEGIRPKTAKDFTSFIPLKEILSEINGVGPNSKKVTKHYEDLIEILGPEFAILGSIPTSEIKSKAGESISQAIKRLRTNQVTKQPGYDGEFGIIKVFS